MQILQYFAKSKRILLLGLFILVFILLLSFTKKPSSAQSSTIQFEITLAQLSKFNGTNPDLPIYLVLEGLVYDVSEGKKFYAPGGAYHDLAGKDSSKQLQIFGAEIIKKKYPVVGKLKQ